MTIEQINDSYNEVHATQQKKSVKTQYHRSDTVEPIVFIDKLMKHYPPELVFYVGNALKYLGRAPFKGDLMGDVTKAHDYLYRALYGTWYGGDTDGEK